jgi:hypothetical protein
LVMPAAARAGSHTLCLKATRLRKAPSGAVKTKSFLSRRECFQVSLQGLCHRLWHVDGPLGALGLDSPHDQPAIHF